MNRYRVQMVAELQAESEEEAIEFLESAYGDVDPEPARVMTLEVKSGEVIDTPQWVANAASNPDRR